MKTNQFEILCGKYLINPAIALENADIVEALQNKDDKEVERILAYDF